MKLWTGYKWRTLSPSEAKYRRARGELVEDKTSCEPGDLDNDGGAPAEPNDEHIDPEASDQVETETESETETETEHPGQAEIEPLTVPGDAPRPPRRCSNCGEPGHTRAKCDKPARDKADQELEQLEG